MGGNAFSKTMTKVVDPFNWSPKVSKSWFGKSMKAVSKVVDPLNIMDPMSVLPTSAAMGKKPYQFDTTYGGAAQKWLGINKQSPYIPPKTKITPLPNSGNNNVMMSNLVNQQKKTDAQSLSNIKDSFAAQNAMQQANINLNTSQAGSEQTGERPPVRTTFTPANNFSAPNLSGLTFGGK
jgi:hypothetical protein